MVTDDDEDVNKLDDNGVLITAESLTQLQLSHKSQHGALAVPCSVPAGIREWR